MSLFRKAGKTFEEKKQAFLDGDDPGFACRSCEERVAEAYEYCPHCGEASVEPID